MGSDDRPFIYIPREVREALGLRRGDYVSMRVEGGRLIVEKVRL